jgi:hypothetical protein
MAMEFAANLDTLENFATMMLITSAVRLLESLISMMMYSRMTRTTRYLLSVQEVETPKLAESAKIPVLLRNR